MFWFLAILATFGYSLQWALLTKIARKGDALSISMYRSLSFSISLLPLLLFADFSKIGLILDFQFELILAAFGAAIAVTFLFKSYKSLPIGISGSFRTISSIFMTVFISWFLFDEYLTTTTLLLISITAIGSVIVSVFKTDFNHLNNAKYLQGISFSIISGIASAIGLVFMVKVARELDPFISGYFWELEIGIVLFLILLARKIFYKKKIEKISKKDFFKIMLASSPTLIGTGAFALASIYGPVGILSAIGVLGIVFTTIFGIIFFKEHLKKIQYIGILIIVIGLIGIKLV